MKLLPRLYKPTEGNILIDNYDIDQVDCHYAGKLELFLKSPYYW